MAFLVREVLEPPRDRGDHLRGLPGWSTRYRRVSSSSVLSGVTISVPQRTSPTSFTAGAATRRVIAIIFKKCGEFRIETSSIRRRVRMGFAVAFQRAPIVLLR